MGRVCPVSAAGPGAVGRLGPRARRGDFDAMGLADRRAPPAGLMTATLRLSPPVCLGDPAAQLVVLRQIDVIQIQAIQESFLLDLAGELFHLPFHIMGVYVRGANK